MPKTKNRNAEPSTKRKAAKSQLVEMERQHSTTRSSRQEKNRSTVVGKELATAIRSTKRRSTAANPPCQKWRRVATTREPESDSATSKGDEEIDETPLIRADIPKIVEAVINNIPKEGNGPPEVDDPHLGE